MKKIKRFFFGNMSGELAQVMSTACVCVWIYAAITWLVLLRG